MLEIRRDVCLDEELRLVESGILTLPLSHQDARPRSFGCLPDNAVARESPDLGGAGSW
jgi:hypothetical protein